MGLIQRGDIDVPSADNPIVRYHNGADGTEEDGVAALANGPKENMKGRTR